MDTSSSLPRAGALDLSIAFAVVLVGAIAALVALLAIPQLDGVYGSFGVALPPVTRWIIEAQSSLLLAFAGSAILQAALLIALFMMRQRPLRTMLCWLGGLHMTLAIGVITALYAPAYMMG